jgi:mannobiose 2-epimerase
MPFWSRISVDHECGVFITHLDSSGRWYSTDKVAAMQGRMVYAFSVAASYLKRDDLLAVADEGVRFLGRHMWDAEDGGWFQRVRRDGTVDLPVKRLWDQAFVLLGLTYFARASGDGEARDYVQRTWELLERFAWDNERGGYMELFASDWHPLDTAKTFCVQVDMLEATRALVALGENERTFERRRELLMDLIGSHLVDAEQGCAIESCDSNWRYDPLRTRDIVQVGHSLKLAGMAAALDLESGRGEHLALGSQLMQFCLDHGLDQSHGGFFQFVYRNGGLAKLEKQWWPQTDAIVSLLALWRLTGEAGYERYFREVEAFAFGSLVDKKSGELYTSCHPDGTPLDTNLGSHWKAAYHTTRLCVLAQQSLDGVPYTLV